MFTEVVMDIRWVIVIGSAALAFGLLSPIIMARRLMFLAGALPHSALLAAMLGIIAFETLGVPVWIASILISVTLVSMVSYLISRGIDPDSSTAIFVSFSVSMTAISIYYILTAFPSEASIWAYIVGDPLLVTWEDAYISLGIAVIVALLTAPFMREHVLIGVDRDLVVLSGIKVAVYDAVLMASMALASVGLLRAVGFVVEHVMILLPGIIGSMLAKSGRDAVVLGLLISMIGGYGGLLLSTLTGLSPSGLMGFILLLIYLIAFRRVRG